MVTDLYIPEKATHEQQCWFKDLQLISVSPESQSVHAGAARPARRCRCARSAARSGLPKSMAFRLLYTLERCGMIEKVGENLYRSLLRPFKQRPYRLGYAAQGTDYQFSKEISTGLQRAAAAQGIELISRRQPLQRQDRAAQRRRARAREGRPRDRVPDRRARGADRRREVPRSRTSR